MQGNYTAFLSIDNQNHIYIELYSFDEEIELLCDKVFVCDSSNHENFEIKVSPGRDMIAFFLYNNVSLLMT
jgi:hypothetical protein